MADEFSAIELGLLSAFIDGGVEFVVVGGTAVRLHGHLRPRKDLDVLVSYTLENAQRVLDCYPFGNFLAAKYRAQDLAQPKAIIKSPDPAIPEVLTSIEGIDTTEAIETSVAISLQGLEVPVLSLEMLLRSKRAVFDDIDVRDVAALEDILARQEGAALPNRGEEQDG